MTWSEYGMHIKLVSNLPWTIPDSVFRIYTKPLCAKTVSELRRSALLPWNPQLRVRNGYTFIAKIKELKVSITSIS